MEGQESEAADYTEDRSNRGGWTACSFVVVYEIFERMAYCGIASNLVLYLARKLQQGTVTASNNYTYWNGAVWLMPVLGAYVADAHLGRYWTFLIACAVYFVGMCLLTLSVSVPGLRPPRCDSSTDPSDCPKPTTLQLAVFFTALYTLAIGTGGTKPNISTIGADQFDDFSPKEKAHKLSFFNWWMFSIFIGILFGNTILVYIQDNVGWAWGYGIPTAGLAVAIAVFVIGTPFYRHKKPNGSPFTRMARVMVAALRKWRVSIPEDIGELHEFGEEVYSKGRFKLESTTALRFLNKACVRTDLKSPWMLCSVTEVEETKQMLKMLPILASSFIPSVMVAQSSTIFIKQGATLDKSMGHHFKLPPASLGTFVTVTLLTFLLLYDRVFVKIVRKWTKNPRGITLLQRLGIGYVLHTIIMVIASVTERYRLNVAKKNGLVESGEEVPLTIFILLPQFVLMGVADACTEVAKLEFFYDQAPESMKSLGTSFYSTSLGVGSILSSFILSSVAHITKANGHKGWILNNLNASRLDLYFAFLAVLSFLNYLAYLVIVMKYSYKAEVSDSMEVLKELEGEKLKTQGQVDLPAQGN